MKPGGVRGISRFEGGGEGALVLDATAEKTRPITGVCPRRRPESSRPPISPATPRHTQQPHPHRFTELTKKSLPEFDPSSKSFPVRTLSSKPDLEFILNSEYRLASSIGRA